MAQTEEGLDLLRSPQLLREYAGLLRKHYAIERTFFDSRVNGTIDGGWRCPAAYDKSTKEGSAWEQLARFLAPHGVEAADYIRRAFDTVEGWRAPKPQELKSYNLLNAYLGRSLHRKEHGRVTRSFNSEKTIFWTKLNEMQSVYEDWPKPQRWQYVLLSEDLSLTPLFRYCVGYSERFRNVVERYRGAAAVQYVRSRWAYDEVWGEWIPPKFKKVAPRLADKALERTFGDA